MAVQYSDAVRNAWGDAWESTIGTAPKVQIRTGSQPANCAASAAGTLVAEYTLASDWSAGASSGAKSLSGLPLSATAVGANTAPATMHYRIVNSAGSTCHEQGSVTATGGGGDMEIDALGVTIGQTLRITAYSKTWAGA